MEKSRDFMEANVGLIKSLHNNQKSEASCHSNCPMYLDSLVYDGVPGTK